MNKINFLIMIIAFFAVVILQFQIVQLGADVETLKGQVDDIAINYDRLGFVETDVFKESQVIQDAVQEK